MLDAATIDRIRSGIAAQTTGATLILNPRSAGILTGRFLKHVQRRREEWGVSQEFHAEHLNGGSDCRTWFGGYGHHGPSDGDHVRVAMTLPLTGPIAVVTIPYRDGLLMGFDDAAKTYNVPRDVFVTDIQDNAGEAKQAINVLQKQMLDPFDVYISGVSGQTRAVAPEIDKKKVPHILYAFDTSYVQGDPNRVPHPAELPGCSSRCISTTRSPKGPSALRPAFELRQPARILRPVPGARIEKGRHRGDARSL